MFLSISRNGFKTRVSLVMWIKLRAHAFSSKDQGSIRNWWKLFSLINSVTIQLYIYTNLTATSTCEHNATVVRIGWNKSVYTRLHTRNCILLTLSYFSACMYLVCFLAFLTIHECHSLTFRLKRWIMAASKLFQNMRESARLLLLANKSNISAMHECYPSRCCFLANFLDYSYIIAFIA